MSFAFAHGRAIHTAVPCENLTKRKEKALVRYTFNLFDYRQGTRIDGLNGGRVNEKFEWQMVIV
jgi:hypothetical protein